MNAGHETQMTRGLSASSEARQMIANWLRITHAPKPQTLPSRATLARRYPCGLLNDAELDALLTILRS